MSLNIGDNQITDFEKKIKKPKKFRTISFYLGLIIAVFYFAYLLHTSPRVDPAIKNSYLFVFLISLFCAGFFVLAIKILTFIFRSIANFFKLIIRRPIFTITAIILIFVSFAGIVYIFSGRAKNTGISLSSIQENLIELISIKTKADSFPVNAKMDTNWEKTASGTKEIINNLRSISTSEFLNDYRFASIAWSKSILESINNSDWKKLNNQPGDFRLTISDTEASDFFTASINKVAELKKTGDAAIKNKDRDAMRKIAASLSVQKHWLNGILHSSDSSLSINIITAANAQDNLLKLPAIPDAGPGCPVETDPNSPNYGKCKIPGAVQAPTEKTKQTPPLIPAEKTKLIPKTNTNEKFDQLLGATPETYTPHAYSSGIRKVCFTAYNGKNICIPEVIEATTDIYESAINYANGKTSGISSWEKAWNEAADTAGIEPSIPSVAGGHEIPSDGAISIGEKDTPPPPSPKATNQTSAPTKTVNTPKATPTPAPTANMPLTTKNDSWDGRYMSPTFRWATLSCTGYNADQQTSPGGFAVFVENNKIKYGSPVDGYKYATINSSGYVSFEENSGGYIDTNYYQFYSKDDKAYVDAKRISRWTSMNYETGKEEETVCTRTVTAQR